MKTRRKLGQNNIRKISKTAGGSSYSITLPIEVVRRWRWKERQKLVLEIDEKNKTIKIKDWKKYPKELLKR